ncbi:MAG: hypothetical protein P4L45_06280, partial [Ignavibacteriaceae bacterium]|nr:hypothetical protein [Ignavibacteriaceae bacterium]
MEKKINEITNIDWQFLVIKGFSHEIYKYLSLKFVPLEAEEVFNDSGKLVLPKVKSTLSTTIGRLFQTNINTRYVMLFETF